VRNASGGIAGQHRKRPVLRTIGVLTSIAVCDRGGPKAATLNRPLLITEILLSAPVNLFLLIRASLRKTNSLRFLSPHAGNPGGIIFLAQLAFSSSIAVGTLSGLEAAANPAGETRLTERRVRFASMCSEGFSVLAEWLIPAGFPLAIPALEVATNPPAPLVYSRKQYFPHRGATAIMILFSVYGCALANLTTLTRMAGAMEGERQLPSSSVARYLAYALVGASTALWGRSRKAGAEAQATGKSMVAKWLGRATLCRIEVCLGLLTIPPSGARPGGAAWRCANRIHRALAGSSFPLLKSIYGSVSIGG